jgi:hypothetical protein
MASVVIASLALLIAVGVLAYQVRVEIRIRRRLAKMSPGYRREKGWSPR